MKLPDRCVRTIALVIALAAGCCGVFAQARPNTPMPTQQQATGSIGGVVVDATGAAIEGARVTLRRKNLEFDQEVFSGADGRFSFSAVVPGEFQITISAVGFGPQTLSGTLHAGEAYAIPLTRLALMAVGTTVQVIGTPDEIAQDQIKFEEKQRVVGFFPNFYVSYVPNAVPLTRKRKFELAWKTMIDPATILLTGAAAGVEQAQDAYSGYGQGAQGYGKRFAAAYADGATDTLIGGAILPSLLRQDPRYFYKGTGTKKARALYAVGNLFVCKGDNQKWQPNYSALLGGLASGGISNLYYPEKDRGAALSLENMGIGMGTAAAFNLLQEFVIRKFTPHVPSYDKKKQ